MGKMPPICPIEMEGIFIIFCGDLGVRVKCDMYMICDMGMDV
jgi:hypothetical protein